MAGRVVVVTGGSGAIGQAVLQAFAAQGDVPVGFDLRVAEQPDDGTPIAGLVVDVTDEVALARAFDQVRREFGAPGVLVNCAGATGRGGILEEPPAEWRRLLDINLTSAYLSCREVVPDMVSAKSGKILNVASVNGRFGGSVLSGPAYAAAKGGLLTLTRFLAREHAKDGIQVNAVAPGPHDTPMWAALDQDRRQRILAMLPGGNGPGAPADLASAVTFLCSPAADYITGATLDINGGQWMG